MEVPCLLHSLTLVRRADIEPLVEMGEMGSLRVISVKLGSLNRKCSKLPINYVILIISTIK